MCKFIGCLRFEQRWSHHEYQFLKDVENDISYILRWWYPSLVGKYFIGKYQLTPISFEPFHLESITIPTPHNKKKNSTPHPPISVSPSPSTLQVWPSWRSHKERKMSTSNSWNTNGSTGNLRTCMCSFLGCCEAPTLKNGGKMCLVFRDKEICLTNYIHIYVYIYIIYIYL